MDRTWCDDPAFPGINKTGELAASICDFKSRGSSILWLEKTYRVGLPAYFSIQPE